MQICSYSAVSGAEYCVLGFREDEERRQLLDVLRSADCFLDSLAAKVNFSSLTRRLEKYVTAPEGMRDAASCRSEKRRRGRADGLRAHHAEGSRGAA